MPSSWGRRQKAGEGRGYLAWRHCGGNWSKASLPGDTDRGYPREHRIVGPGWEYIVQALSCISVPPKARHTNKAMSLSSHTRSHHLSKITYFIVQHPGVGLCSLMAQT